MRKALTWFSTVRNSKDTLTLWMNNLIVLYAFFLPIDSSIKSRIIIAIMLLFVLRGDVINYIKEAWQNGVVRAFAYTVGVYAIWLIGTDDWKEGLDSFKSIKSALYIFLFFILIDGRYREKILGGFILGMMVSEILSYLMFFQLIPWEFAIAGEYIYKAHAVGDPSPFLHHIHYGVLLAFTVVILAQHVMYSQDDKRLKIVMAFFVVTASINIFITGGRTGYFTFFPVLMLFVFYYHRRWLMPALLGAVLFAGVMYQTSPILQQKMEQTRIEIEKIFHADTNFNSSLGQRVGFWVFSTEVIKENFLLGVGTGDSMAEVRAVIPPEHEGVKTIAHEHNQYISVMLQFGIIGFLVFMNIFYQIYKFKNEDQDMRFVMLAITLAIGIGITMTMFNLRIFLHLWILILALAMVSPSRRTIQEDVQDNRTFLLQTGGLGVVFYLAIFFKEVLLG